MECEDQKQCTHVTEYTVEHFPFANDSGHVIAYKLIACIWFADERVRYYDPVLRCSEL